MPTRPTWGEIAGPQVRAAGLLFFPDVDAEIRRRLERATNRGRQNFALRCARRAMTRHRSLPTDSQSAYTLRWGAVLDLIEAALQGDASARADVMDALTEFRTEPTDPDAQGGDADENAAAAAIYAADCLRLGRVEDAAWAAGRVIDIAFAIADQELIDQGEWTGKVDGFIRAASHHVVQDELRRQLDDAAELLGEAR